jgi:hypothetical protein
MEPFGFVQARCSLIRTLPQGIQSLKQPVFYLSPGGLDVMRRVAGDGFGPGRIKFRGQDVSVINETYTGRIERCREALSGNKKSKGVIVSLVNPSSFNQAQNH